VISQIWEATTAKRMKSYGRDVIWTAFMDLNLY